MVDDPGKYPMISDDSLLLPTGMTSYVSILATSVTSDDGIRSISPDRRNCYFYDEFPLKLHVNYTRCNTLDKYRQIFLLWISDQETKRITNIAKKISIPDSRKNLYT